MDGAGFVGETVCYGRERDFLAVEKEIPYFAVASACAVGDLHAGGAGAVCVSLVDDGTSTRVAIVVRLFEWLGALIWGLGQEFLEEGAVGKGGGTTLGVEPPIGLI